MNCFSFLSLSLFPLHPLSHPLSLSPSLQPYSENPAEYTPPTQEQMAKLKSEKKQKNVEKRQKIIESRKNLASVRYMITIIVWFERVDYWFHCHCFRVVQKNLVFVIGLSPRLADPEVLKKNEYFGKFGRIYKVVINNHTVYNGAQVNKN